MEIITKPTDKLGKVKWLLNIAKELNILKDDMFDQLMDKYENNFDLFDFMYEEINTMIISKDSIIETKIAFIACLRCKSFEEIGKYLTYLSNKPISNERLYF